MLKFRCVDNAIKALRVSKHRRAYLVNVSYSLEIQAASLQLTLSVTLIIR